MIRSPSRLVALGLAPILFAGVLSGVGPSTRHGHSPSTTAAASYFRSWLALTLIPQGPPWPVPFTGIAAVPGDTHWVVPRYPGLQSTTIQIPSRFDSLPYVVPAYLRMAERTFWVKAPLQAVNQWYAYQPFPRFSPLDSSQTLGDGAAYVVTDTRQYLWDLGIGQSPATLSLVMRPDRGGTVVQYWAEAVISPPRPQGRDVPKNCRWLELVTTEQTSQKVEVDFRRIVSVNAVEHLVSLVNTLEWARTLGRLPGPTIGRLYYKKTARLIFHTQTGKTVTVSTSNLTGSVELDGIQLADWNLSVLNAALAMR